MDFTPGPHDTSAISCERCRKRKIKCDRRQPCAKCRKAGVECTRAGTGEKQRPMPKSYVQALESQVASLEIFIQRLASSNEDRRQEMLEEYVKESAAAAKQSESSSPSRTGCAAVDEQQSASGSVAPRARAGQLRKTSSGASAHFYGGTSLFHIHMDACPDLSTDEGCSPIMADHPSATPTNMPASALETHQDLTLIHSSTSPSGWDSAFSSSSSFPYMPHDEVPRRLMTVFFKHQYQYNMCLYREYFLRDYDLSEGRYFSPLLLWSICAVGAVATHEPALSSLFATQAQSLLYASLDSPSLTLLQSLIVLCQLDIGRGRASKGWLYCGMASRLAHEMGLHLDPNNWGGGDDRDGDDANTRELDIDREILRRVYWGAFIVDKQLSLYFGRPPALYPHESDVLNTVRIPYPPGWAKLLDTYIAPGTSVTAFEDGIGLINALGSRAELSKIIHTMITDVFENRRRQTSDVAVVAATVGRVHVSLTKWLAGLPSRLHWNQWTMGQLPPYVYHLHLAFHTVMIILHRPPRQLIRVGDDDDIEICYESLGAILRLLRSYSRYYEYQFLPLDFVHTLSTAAGTILMRRHSENLPWDDAETCRSLDLVMQAMESVKEAWPCITEILRGIQNARSTAASSIPDINPVIGLDFFNNDLDFEFGKDL